MHDMPIDDPFRPSSGDDAGEREDRGEDRAGPSTEPYLIDALPVENDDSSGSSPNGEDAGEDAATLQIMVDRVLRALEHGHMEEKGLLPYSSNYSFLVVVDDGELQLPAVYKPRRGENPLWDFPSGTLCQRETAAYEISNALNWHLVPPTVLREGTRGIGSVQFFIDCDPDIHYFTVREDARYAAPLRRMALFDYIINNADRKSGHCLLGYDERLWAIDHGVCFHYDYKLRTVIWEFSNQSIAKPLVDDLAQLLHLMHDVHSELRQRLNNLISARERKALCDRIESLLRRKRYPSPRPYQRNHPWPPI